MVVFAACLLTVWGIIQQLEAGDILNCMPRKTVTYQYHVIHSGSQRPCKDLANENWISAEDRELECLRRGKSKAECQNYILILHKINDTSLYVCGTNAFLPACDYMVINNGKLRLQGKAVESRGNCPFEPTLKYASLMVGGALYSATSNNFLGTEPIILRSLRNPLRTEFKALWLNEPTFVHMDLVPDSSTSTDRIYVFFTETAIEFEYYDKILVSRIAQICTSDLGGKRVLKKRWTSFLKSTLICSVPELDFQFNIIQDAFVLKAADGRETIFYGIFTQQWGKLDISAVCAFSMESIQDIFLKGSYKGPLSMEHSHVKWVLYRGEVPSPRPGACIDVSARNQGYNSSLDLPDRVLQFARNHPLLDDAVTPIDYGLVLLRRGTKYTRLVVDRAFSLDNSTYDILFLGTDRGYLHKALSCHGEMFIIEEIQLFPTPEPVQTLKLAPKKGLLYAGSASRLVQLPVATCSWYECCFDCVLARDPYCAWSLPLHSCVRVADQPWSSQDLIQSVSNGDATQCPKEEQKLIRYPLILGSSLHLRCTSISNLASSIWMLNQSLLQAEEGKYFFHAEGLVIFSVTVADAGLYECQSVEKANRKEFLVTTVAYLLYPQPEKDFLVPKHGSSHQTRGDLAVTNSSRSLAVPEREEPARQEQIQGPSFILLVWGSLFAFLFLSLLAWNVYKGHLSLPWKTRNRRPAMANTDGLAGPDLGLGQRDSAQKSSAAHAASSTTSESAPLVSCSEVGRGAKVKRGTSPTMGPIVCSSPNGLVTEESTFPEV
ncbi:semaphorin-4D-like [Eublepharis macularius]|uniref:Semaphorin-4D-like n=1 Tax=Eublepharis macularius TaxID=481883 RepID=A0AA97JEK3_EUBMA|nr:semaphorin-4D-like [Eublepharis macularius]